MNDYGLYLGIAAMILGIIIFLKGKSITRIANASNGSTAVAGNNSGIILNTNTNSTPSPSPQSHGGHKLTIAAIIVELVGISVTLWHAFHLAK